MPYYYHWLKRMEGRFTPGECPLFDWYHNSLSAKDEMKEKGRGGLFYFYSEDDAENADAKRLEHETFFDDRVRFFGGQLTAALLEMQLEPELAKELGVTKTPAVAVLDADGKAIAVLQGEIEADALADALKKVAPEKKPPKKGRR
jgi:hypothetical protein